MNSDSKSKFFKKEENEEEDEHEIDDMIDE